MKTIMSAEDAWQWIKHQFTRKWTVWVHVFVGAFCAALCLWLPVLGVLLFLAFAFFEWWQAAIEFDPGHLDFWDAIFGFGLGSGILWILTLTGAIA